MKITLVGTGRAGTSFFGALTDVGHEVSLVHHGDEVPPSDLVILCVPDDAISEVARSLSLPASTVLAHCAGSRTLEVLGDHDRVASLHPLAALPNGELGARRLRGAVYCVAGDGLVHEVVQSLQGRAVVISDDRRAAYHATACVAANHVVTLLGHVQRLADSAGLELADFLALAQHALDDVANLGPVDALTGPASRGDLATIDSHLAAIPESERATYVALASAALALAEQRRATTPQH